MCSCAVGKPREQYVQVCDSEQTLRYLAVSSFGQRCTSRLMVTYSSRQYETLSVFVLEKLRDNWEIFQGRLQQIGRRTCRVLLRSLRFTTASYSMVQRKYKGHWGKILFLMFCLVLTCVLFEVFNDKFQKKKVWITYAHLLELRIS